MNKNPAAYSGWTPLHSAAEHGHLNICKLIIENIVNKNSKTRKGVTPIHLAVMNGNFEVCKAITEHEKKSPLMKIFNYLILNLKIKIRKWISFVFE